MKCLTKDALNVGKTRLRPEGMRNLQLKAGRHEEFAVKR